MSDDPAMDIAKYLNAITDTWFPEMKMAADGPGNNLYVNDMPDSPDFAVAVMRYEGGTPSETFENPLQVRHPRVQVMIRHTNSNIALSRGNDILKKLTVIKDQVLSGTKYQRIKAVGEPFEIGPDSKNRERVAVNFSVSYYDSI